MTKEELEKRVATMIACDKLNNHEYKNNKCIKCGRPADKETFSYSLTWSFDSIISLIADAMSGKGILNKLNKMANNLVDINLKYEDDILFRDYIFEKMKTIKQKYILENLRHLYIIYGGDLDEVKWLPYRSLTPPFKEIVMVKETVLKNRYFTKEWANEIKDLNFLEFRHETMYYKMMDYEPFLDLLEDRLKQGKILEALNLSWSINTSYMLNQENYKVRIKVKKSLIPFLSPSILNRISGLINLDEFAEDIVKLFTMKFPATELESDSTILELLTNATEYLRKQNKPILFNYEYVYKPNDEMIEIAF